MALSLEGKTGAIGFYNMLENTIWRLRLTGILRFVTEEGTGTLEVWEGHAFYGTYETEENVYSGLEALKKGLEDSRKGKVIFNFKKSDDEVNSRLKQLYEKIQEVPFSPGISIRWIKDLPGLLLYLSQKKRNFCLKALLKDTIVISLFKDGEPYINIVKFKDIIRLSFTPLEGVNTGSSGFLQYRDSRNEDYNEIIPLKPEGLRDYILEYYSQVK